MANNKQFLDEEGLRVLWELIKFRIDQKPFSAITHPTEIWDAEGQDYVPGKGELIVYEDYAVDPETGENIPGIKVGNGTSLPVNLKFVNKDFEEKLQHKLTIGSYVYDGSEDVTVPVYLGDFIE